MKNFKDLVQLRRSHRKFTDEEISPEDVSLILRSALMSPTSKGRRSWQFVVVEDKIKRDKLADCKEANSQFIREAPMAIVVLGNPDDNPCWVEDGSVATITMQYQAEDLGLGTCWVQIRGNVLSDGSQSDDIVHGILGLPDNQKVLCILAIGHKVEERKPQNEDKLKWENIHIEEY